MRKKRLILLSLIPFAINACSCDNKSDKNKKMFNIVCGNCMAFMKDIFLTADEYIDSSDHSLREYSSELQQDAYTVFGYLYIFQNLVQDGSLPVVSNTLAFDDEGETEYFRTRLNSKSNQFYIEYCFTKEEQDNYGYDYDYYFGNSYAPYEIFNIEHYCRIDVSYNYSTNTVNEIRFNESTITNDNDDIADLTTIKYTNSFFEVCYDRENYFEDDTVENYVNKYVTPFKKTFSKAKKINVDFGDRMYELGDEIMEELGVDIYF